MRRVWALGMAALLLTSCGNMALLPVEAEERVRFARIRVEGKFPCQEDEVLKGVGDYNGRAWAAWRCIPADDL